ncbi:MAG: cadherin domain-containing protein, partial [Planctomycetales bacterium]|nr:cadherin domain-containing protein [Planctomycetales bacterium]
DGSLDTSFGGGTGKVATAIGIGADNAKSVKVLANGKILVVGSAIFSGSYDIALVQYNADGSLDTSFGGGDGIANSGIAGSDEGNCVAVQSDGKILVAGSDNSNFLLARFLSDGSLDTSYGTSGRVSTDFAGGLDKAYSMTLQADGKALLGGLTFNGTSFDFGVVRYHTDGTHDTSFNSTGKVSIDLGANSNDTGYAITTQTDGKILLSGWTDADGGNDFGLVRLNSNGSLDTTFNGTGKVVTPIGSGSDLGLSVTVQSDGKILVAGQSNTAGNNFAAVRYNSDGSLDTTFGGTGKVDTNFGGSSDDRGAAVLVQSDGKILVAGTSTINGNYDFAIGRFNTDGSLDARFNTTSTLGGTVAYTEGGSPVVLDNDVSIFDIELSSLNNFSGASLTLVRSGGTNAQDQFSATGLLGVLTQAGNLVYNGTTIGTVTTNSGGTLVLTFNSNATQTNVNAAMRLIGYSNNSDTPPSSVQINWTFNDGNSGSQGTGGALTANGSTTVNITATNDEQALAINTGMTVLEGSAGNVITTAMLQTTDVDNTAGQLVYTVTGVPTNGFIRRSGIDLTVSSTFTQADIDAGIITYLHNDSETSSDSFTFTVDDGSGTISGGTFIVTVTAVNDNNPIITSNSGGATASINVNENATTVTTVTATDADLPSQTLTYSKIGGADSALFTVDGSTGVLSFITAPDYENPTDIGGDNTYEVVVQVSDGTLTDTQTITVSVKNVADGIRVTPLSTGPLGGETLVNTTTSNVQSITSNVAQAIAADASGNYVVVWGSNAQDGDLYGIFAQRFNADGVPQGTEFQINSTTTDQQLTPTVAMDRTGNFVVTWMSNLQDGDSYGIYAQRYNAAGVAQGSEFLVNSTTVNAQTSPAVAMAANGSFIINWTSSGQDPDSSSGIYAQRFDASGVAMGGEFRVNTYTSGTQQLTSIAADSAGNFVITWASDGQDGSNYGVFGQRFDAAGAAQGAEFQVNTTTADSQLYHDVTMLEDGRFAVAYQSRSGSTYE